MINKEQLVNEFYILFKAEECSVSESDYELFENKLKLLKQLSEVENSSMTVFDFHRGVYAFVRSKFDNQVCYPFNDVFKKEPKYFFNLMPYPDLKFTIDTMKKTFGFFNHLEGKRLKDYKLIFEFRLSDPAGKLFCFLQQCVVLELDKSDNIWMVLILNDLVPNRIYGNKLLRKLIHIPSGKICLFQDDFDQSSNTFLSKRETEIIGLLSQGLQSKEISYRLFISVNTVNNHRQRIIEKLNAENTYEALGFAKTVGII